MGIDLFDHDAMDLTSVRPNPVRKESTAIIKKDDTSEMFNCSDQIEAGLVFADKFINRNYLMGLNQYPVVPLKDGDFGNNCIRMFHVHKIIFNENEDINDKLISVYGSLHDLQSSVFIMIESDGKEVNFYIGICSTQNPAVAGAILEKGFKGNFPGSIVTGLKNEEIEKIMGDIVKSSSLINSKNVASVSIIPSPRDDNKEKFVQGIEKFINTMHGSAYSAIILAEPVSKDTLEMRKRGFEELYSTISPYCKTQIAFGKSDSYAVSKGNFTNFANSINRSVSNSATVTTGENHGTQRGGSFGIGGFGINSGRSYSSTKGYSSSNSWANSVTEGETESQSNGTSDSDTTTNTDSRTITLSHENKSVSDLLEKIKAHLDRITKAETFGFWECGAYFIAQDIQTSVIAANSYKSLMAGNNSSVENSFVNIWDSRDIGTGEILKYLKCGTQPRIMIPSFEKDGKEVITPSAMISGGEIPIVLGLPRYSVPGLMVVDMAEFGRNVYYDGKRENTRNISLGHIFHMGEREEEKVELDIDSLASHCFITGSTGSGKSNTSYQILGELIKNGIKFLVIEPVKGEYKKVFGALPGLNIFCTNPDHYSMLKLNPFRFDEGIHVLEHLDRIVEIFNACWPMYAAMPAILKSAFEQAYKRCGWDLDSSLYFPNGKKKYPDFSDVLEVLPEIINSSEYSADSKGDYTGALVTRVKSLTIGITGQVFCSGSDIPDEILFDRNTIVDLSRVGSTETKSLIMGILILKINEYRSLSSEEDSPLKHVTVLEEAHNILKRTSKEQSQEGSNLLGKSVEMICNSIAEVRTYGEGFIIIDQSPTSVDISAIKNTNTKIVMNLPEKKDCEMVGSALSLDEKQISEIPKLGKGKAIVRQTEWVKAVLSDITYYKKVYYAAPVVVDKTVLAKAKGSVLEKIYTQYTSGKFDFSEAGYKIKESGINKYKREELAISIRELMKSDASAVSKQQFAAFVVDFLNCGRLCSALPVSFVGFNLDRDSYTEKIRKEAQEWFRKFYTALNRYFAVDNNKIKTAIAQYILLHEIKTFEEDDRYIIIYETIFM